ncbi:hypothetical protein B0H14DRAFT_3146163 [Mycena olivaceomarginata]|nr:hypothetical protein B0H14DRAFT_3146163 [Mycena olivaceomarginata]
MCITSGARTTYDNSVLVSLRPRFLAVRRLPDLAVFRRLVCHRADECVPYTRCDIWEYDHCGCLHIHNGQHIHTNIEFGLSILHHHQRILLAVGLRLHGRILRRSNHRHVQESTDHRPRHGVRTRCSHRWAPPRLRAVPAAQIRARSIRSAPRRHRHQRPRLRLRRRLHRSRPRPHARRPGVQALRRRPGAARAGALERVVHGADGVLGWGGAQCLDGWAERVDGVVCAWRRAREAGLPTDAMPPAWAVRRPRTAGRRGR